MPEPPTPTIGAVVVAYRSAATIETCVSSCLADDNVREIVVQDNSADGDTRAIIESLQRVDGRVRYQQGENVGFGAGCNAGVAALAGEVEWLAFVNPDVELTRLISDLVTSPEAQGATVVGAHVESPNGPGILSARNGVTPWRELLKSVIGPRAYAIHAHRFGEVPFRVDQVSGAFLVLRKGEFGALGGFDERFELYYEEVDLCARAARRGGCVFFPALWGHHAGGASAESVSRLSYVVLRISRMRYLRKHYPGPLTEVLLPVLMLSELVARTFTGTREGSRIRLAGVRAQGREFRRSGSVRVLS